MALASLVNPAPRPRPMVPLAALTDGVGVVPDSGFACLQVGYPHTVRVDPELGPYVGCHCPGLRGRHYLARHVEPGGNVVGMRRYRPAPGAPA